ncbi:MAG: helix-turn-helix domain-containing protein [Solirubrobacterales bacterium]
MTEPWLTKRELAEELKVSPSTIERLALPHLRVGNQNRYKMSEVIGHLQGERRGDNVVSLRGGAV